MREKPDENYCAKKFDEYSSREGNWTLSLRSQTTVFTFPYVTSTYSGFYSATSKEAEGLMSRGVSTERGMRVNVIDTGAESLVS